MVGAEKLDRVLIIKHRLRLFERDTVLPSIQRGLCPVPLEANIIHMYNVNIPFLRGVFKNLFGSPSAPGIASGGKTTLEQVKSDLERRGEVLLRDTSTQDTAVRRGLRSVFRPTEWGSISGRVKCSIGYP